MLYFLKILKISKVYFAKIAYNDNEFI